MANYTATDIKALRERTGAGMLDVKKALDEADGDADKALELIRVKGLKGVSKREGRSASDGLVTADVSPTPDGEGEVGVLVEVNSETDFVGRNAEFTGFAAELAEHIAAEAPSDVENLLTQTISHRGFTVAELFGEKVSKLGENMGVARFVREEITGNGAVATYIHGGGKIGVLATFSFEKPETAENPAFKAFAKDVAMQIAAAAPMNANRAEIAADVVEHELSIYRAQAAESGKPEAIQHKIAEGRLEKFYKEVVLTEQVFVKNPDISVSQLVASVSKEVGDEITVVGFDRYALGETGEPAPAGC